MDTIQKIDKFHEDKEFIRKNLPETIIKMYKDNLEIFIEGLALRCEFDEMMKYKEILNEK